MLVVGTDLPAEANAVQLLDTAGVHAGGLALPVKLVLTTLALDPVNLRCEMVWNLPLANVLRVNLNAQLHG